MWCFPGQTAEIILRNNPHSSATEMVLEPLLRERVRFLTSSSSDLKRGPPCSPLSPCCRDLFRMQSFGVFEGRPKDELRNLANACGQSSRDFTPPGGETPDEVNQAQLRKTEREQQHHAVDALSIVLCSKKKILQYKKRKKICLYTVIRHHWRIIELIGQLRMCDSLKFRYL